MTEHSTGALPRLAVALPKISRVSALDDHPVGSIWTDTYSQLTAHAERRLCAVANDRSPAQAIRPGRAGEAGRVACAAFAGTPGVARRLDLRSRSNVAKSRVAMLALSVFVASLPWARAWAACQSPTNTFLNPFNKESAHHRPIGSGAAYADRNHPTTVALLKTGFGTINSDNGWGFNIYQSKLADPLKTVVQAGAYNIGLPVTLRVPVGANNHNTSDAGVAIVEPNTITAHEFYQWRWNNGKPVAGIHRTWSTRSNGQGSRMGVSASGLPALYGLIRGHEINVPGYKIEHALQISLSHPFNGCRVSQLQNKVVWPAISTDWYVRPSRPSVMARSPMARCSPYRRAPALPPSA
jgi:hypothetical protein